MNSIDNALKKMLGNAKKKSKSTMKPMKGFSMSGMKPMKGFSMNNSMNKMMGMKLNHPRVGSRPTKRDLDGDGISNKKDCQPRNIMRQDAPFKNRTVKHDFLIQITPSFEDVGFEVNTIHKLTNKKIPVHYYLDDDSTIYHKYKNKLVEYGTPGVIHLEYNNKRYIIDIWNCQDNVPDDETFSDYYLENQDFVLQSDLNDKHLIEKYPKEKLSNVF